MDTVRSNSDQSSDSNNNDDPARAPDIEDLRLREYRCKQDIIDAVQDYHARAMRNFKVVASDKRQYKVVCAVETCGFVAQFAFKATFKRPSKLIPHSCPPDLTIGGSRRFCTAKYLVKHIDLREFFLSHGRKTSPILFKRKAEELGLCPTYLNCVNACNKLVVEMYGTDYTQYHSLPSYIDELIKNGHKATCDVADGVFVRLAILYREGVQSFSHYANRGLSIDGTFLKTSIGGTLLVACFRNGNSELEIVGVAIVAIENQDNWEFFLRFLMSNLEAPPVFLISDRDKGLVPAVLSLDPVPHHFFCFRHLMENFNRKFKSRPLKDTAWALARSRMKVQFEEHAQMLTSMNLNALQWLLDVGKEKWSLCFSPCPRYGTLTSNNVESVNGVLRGIRKLPVLDCLMAIERYVGAKWVTCGNIVKSRGTLTHRASSRVTRSLSSGDNVQVTQYSESSFIVAVKKMRDKPPVEYSVQFVEARALCTCGYEEDMRAPCTHSLLSLRKVGREEEKQRFFDDSWLASTYSSGHKQGNMDKMSPPVLKSSLRECTCAPPRITKRRGRPKKHQRRESQAATLALCTPENKKHRCSTCGEKGHNKRRHQCRETQN